MDDGVIPHTFDGLLQVPTNVGNMWHHCLRMQHVDIMPQMCIFAIIDSQGYTHTHIYIYVCTYTYIHLFLSWNMLEHTQDITRQQIPSQPLAFV